MKKITKDGRIQLFADEGKIITDGADVFGHDITLAVGKDSSAYFEIPVEEYEAKIASELADIPDMSDVQSG